VIAIVKKMKAPNNDAIALSQLLFSKLLVEKI